MWLKLKRLLECQNFHNTCSIYNCNHFSEFFFLLNVGIGGFLFSTLHKHLCRYLILINRKLDLSAKYGRQKNLLFHTRRMKIEFLDLWPARVLCDLLIPFHLPNLNRVFSNWIDHDKKKSTYYLRLAVEFQVGLSFLV